MMMRATCWVLIAHASWAACILGAMAASSPEDEHTPPSPPPPALGPYKAVSDSNVISGFYINAFLGFFLLTAFCIIQSFRGAAPLYRFRTISESVTLKPPDIDLSNRWSRYFLWAVYTYRASDLDVLMSCGLDAFVMTKIPVLGMQLFTPLAIVSIAVLIPVHLSFNWLQDNANTINSSNLSHLTLSAVPPGSPVLWLHFSLLYLYVGYAMVLLYYHYVQFARLRLRYMNRGDDLSFYAEILADKITNIRAKLKTAQRKADSQQTRAVVALEKHLQVLLQVMDGVQQRISQLDQLRDQAKGPPVSVVRQQEAEVVLYPDKQTFKRMIEEDKRRVPVPPRVPPANGGVTKGKGTAVAEGRLAGGAMRVPQEQQVDRHTATSAGQLPLTLWDCVEQRLNAMAEHRRRMEGLPPFSDMPSTSAPTAGSPSSQQAQDGCVSAQPSRSGSVAAPVAEADEEKSVSPGAHKLPASPSHQSHHKDNPYWWQGDGQDVTGVGQWGEMEVDNLKATAPVMFLQRPSVRYTSSILVPAQTKEHRDAKAAEMEALEALEEDTDNQTEPKSTVTSPSQSTPGRISYGAGARWESRMVGQLPWGDAKHTGRPHLQAVEVHRYAVLVTDVPVPPYVPPYQPDKAGPDHALRATSSGLHKGTTLGDVTKRETVEVESIGWLRKCLGVRGANEATWLSKIFHFMFPSYGRVAGMLQDLEDNMEHDSSLNKHDDSHLRSHRHASRPHLRHRHRHAAGPADTGPDATPGGAAVSAKDGDAGDIELGAVASSLPSAPGAPPGAIPSYSSFSVGAQQSVFSGRSAGTFIQLPPLSQHSQSSSSASTTAQQAPRSLRQAPRVLRAQRSHQTRSAGSASGTAVMPRSMTAPRADTAVNDVTPEQQQVPGCPGGDRPSCGIGRGRGPVAEATEDSLTAGSANSSQKNTAGDNVAAASADGVLSTTAVGITLPKGVDRVVRQWQARARGGELWDIARDAVYSGRVRRLPESSAYDPVSAVFKKLLPHDFDRAIPIMDYTRVHFLLRMWNFHAMGLDTSLAIYDEQHVRPRHVPCPKGVIQPYTVDSLNYLTRLVERTQLQIIDERHKAINAVKGGTGCYFVLFKTQTAAAMAARFKTVLSEDTGKFLIHPAPAPNDVNWRMLLVPSRLRRLRQVLMVLPKIIMVLFPITAFSAAFQQLDFVLCGGSSVGVPHSGDAEGGDPLLFKRPPPAPPAPPPLGAWAWPWYCAQESPVAWAIKKLLIGWGPSWLLSLYQGLILPNAFVGLAQESGSHLTLSSLDREVCNLYWYWNLFNVFLGGVLAGSTVQQRNRGVLTNGVAGSLTLLGAALPGSSNFYINFLCHKTFVGFCSKLLMPNGGVFWYLFRLYIRCYKTVSVRERLFFLSTCRSPRYGPEIGNLLMAFVVGCSFLLVSPIVPGVAAVFFLFAYFTWKYFLLYLNVRKYETGGDYFPWVFDRLLGCLAIFVVFTACVLGAKEAVTQFWLILASLPWIILAFGLRCRRRFAPMLHRTPLEVAIRAPPARVDPERYIHPALHPQALGWHPDLHLVWTGIGIWGTL